MIELPDLKNIGAKTAGDVAAFCVSAGVAGYVEGAHDLLQHATTIEASGFGALTGFGLKKFFDMIIFRK